MADAFRPQLSNFNHLSSLKNMSDANDYNIGMPFGIDPNANKLI
jgi:hypothetical protein